MSQQRVSMTRGGAYTPRWNVKRRLIAHRTRLRPVPSKYRTLRPGAWNTFQRSERELAGRISDTVGRRVS